MRELSKQTYFKRHDLQTNLKLKKTPQTQNTPLQKTHNPKTTTCCLGHHTSGALSLCTAAQAVLLPLRWHSSALCLSPRQPSHHLPVFVSLPGTVQSIHIFLGCLNPKDEKTSICSRLPATGVFISLFLSSLKRGKSIAFCKENFLC